MAVSLDGLALDGGSHAGGKEGLSQVKGIQTIAGPAGCASLPLFQTVLSVGKLKLRNVPMSKPASPLPTLLGTVPTRKCSRVPAGRPPIFRARVVSVTFEPIRTPWRRFPDHVSLSNT